MAAAGGDIQWNHAGVAQNFSVAGMSWETWLRENGKVRGPAFMTIRFK